MAEGVEITVGKGRNAHYKQFRLCRRIADLYKPGLVWERIKRKYMYCGTRRK